MLLCIFYLLFLHETERDDPIHVVVCVQGVGRHYILPALSFKEARYDVQVNGCKVLIDTSRKRMYHWLSPASFNPNGAVVEPEKFDIEYAKMAVSRHRDTNS